MTWGTRNANGDTFTAKCERDARERVAQNPGDVVVRRYLTEWLPDTEYTAVSLKDLHELSERVAALEELMRVKYGAMFPPDESDHTWYPTIYTNVGN